MLGDPARNTPAVWTRRDLLTRSAWGMLLAAGGVGLVSTVRLLFPRVRATTGTTVVLCRPEQLAVGAVSERWKSSHRLTLVRDRRGFHALWAVCTHLGCIPDWDSIRRRYHCPCHGSIFRADGVNLEGPAPRPLERLKIWLDEEGRIVVDTQIRFRRERGEWSRKGAFLRYPARTTRG